MTMIRNRWTGKVQEIGWRENWGPQDGYKMILSETVEYTELPAKKMRQVVPSIPEKKIRQKEIPLDFFIHEELWKICVNAHVNGQAVSVDGVLNEDDGEVLCLSITPLQTDAKS